MGADRHQVITTVSHRRGECEFPVSGNLETVRAIVLQDHRAGEAADRATHGVGVGNADHLEVSHVGAATVPLAGSVTLQVWPTGWELTVTL